MNMKKFFLLWSVCISLSGFSIGQDNLIAKRNGDGYEMLVSRKDFTAIFDAEVAPYLNPGSGLKYSLENIAIDDPEPGSYNSHAYFELKAISDRETITVGLQLVKVIDNNMVTRLFVPNIIASRSQEPDMVTDEAGWKCTSTRIECGGCRRIRENGHVIGCSCGSGEGYCNFETTGGGGNNWPGWLTSIILVLLRFV